MKRVIKASFEFEELDDYLDAVQEHLDEMGSHVDAYDYEVREFIWENFYNEEVNPSQTAEEVNSEFADDFDEEW